MEWNAWFERAIFDDDDDDDAGARAGGDETIVNMLTAMPVATCEGVVRAMRRARSSERAFEACARALVVVARRESKTIRAEEEEEDGDARGVNACEDIGGLNAVCMASKFGFADALGYLLDNGCDASGCGSDSGSRAPRASPLMCAIVGASQALTPSMLSKSSSATGGAWADDEDVIARVRSRFVASVALLLARADVDVNARDHHTGWTALTFAARKNIPELVDIILTRANDVDVNAPDSQGKTPIIHAALANALDVVRALRARGADPHIPDHDGWTAAMHAAFRHPQNLALLVAIDQ